MASARSIGRANATALPGHGIDLTVAAQAAKGRRLRVNELTAGSPLQGRSEPAIKRLTAIALLVELRSGWVAKECPRQVLGGRTNNHTDRRSSGGAFGAAVGLSRQDPESAGHLYPDPFPRDGGSRQRKRLRR